MFALGGTQSGSWLQPIDFADVDSANSTLFVGAWLIILTTLVGTVALVGFYDALKSAGPVMGLAPILGVVGLGLVTISHLIPIALAYAFVPGYVAADEATKASMAASSTPSPA